MRPGVARESGYAIGKSLRWRNLPLTVVIGVLLPWSTRRPRSQGEFANLEQTAKPQDPDDPPQT